MKFTLNSFFQLSEEIKRHQRWVHEKANFGEPLLSVNEVLCFCTGLTKKHFTHLMQTGNEAFNLDTLMLTTRAGYHCTGCVGDLKKYWDSELARFGLLSPSVELKRTRVGKDSKRLTYAGQYPTYWISKLVELQNEWREREKFNEEFHFEIVDAPVPYVDYLLVGECDQNKAEIYFAHFIHFVEFRTNAKWHLSLIKI